MALGLLLAIPWYATGFLDQLLGHHLSPGGSNIGLGRLVQSYLLLLFFNLGTLEPALGWTLAAVGGVLLALAGLGAVRACRAGDEGPAGAVIAANALLLGPLAALAALAFPRSGFHWSYLAGAVPPLAVLAGTGLAAVPRRVVPWTAIPLALGLAAGAATQALSPGTEDLRGAAAWVIANRRPGDAVLPVEWSPPFFPRGLAWSYYGAPRAPDLPVLEHDRGFRLHRFPAADPPARVHALLRGVPPDAPLLGELRARYGRIDTAGFGYGVVVSTFSLPRS